MNSEFERKKAIIFNSPRPDFFRYMGLLEKVTGTRNMSEIHTTLKDVIGEQLHLTLRDLESGCPDWSSIFRKINENNGYDEELYKEMDSWVDRNDKACIIYDAMNLLLENWISKKETTSVIGYDETEIRKINEEINKSHDWKLTSEHCVYHLFNDGEITNTKGGSIYGMRSTFSSYPPVLGCPKLKLPIESGQGAYTYAVLTKKDAKRYREILSEFVKCHAS